MKPLRMARFGLLFTLLVWAPLLLAQSTETASLTSELSNFSLHNIASPVYAHSDYHGPADRVPFYPGGNKDLIEYIQSAIKYPELARDYAIEGEAVVEFFLDEIGEVQSPAVVASPGFGLGKEALRIVQEMPQWEPAIVNGRPASSKKMRLAVMFRLR